MKRSNLANAVLEIGLKNIGWIRFAHPRRKGSVTCYLLTAWFTPATGDSAAYIYSVPSNRKTELEKVFVEEVFPAYLKWVGQFEDIRLAPRCLSRYESALSRTLLSMGRKSSP